MSRIVILSEGQPVGWRDEDGDNLAGERVLSFDEARKRIARAIHKSITDEDDDNGCALCGPRADRVLAALQERGPE